MNSISSKRLNLLSISIACGLFVLLGMGCNNPPKIDGAGNSFEVSGFAPVCNFDSLRKDDGKIYFVVDYSDVTAGVAIPSHLQDPSQLQYVFKIRNTTDTPRKYRYKLYYQNESYKFSEILQGDSTQQHPQAHENFYGSWANGDGFRETGEIPADGDFHVVTGDYRIIGNPRDEQKYFYADINDRWKRNPRMGKYSFLLVVTAVESGEKQQLPEYCSNLSVMDDSSYVNPYYYFLYGKGKGLADVVAISSSDTLVAKSQLPLDEGVYVEPSDFEGEQYEPHYSKQCGQTGELRQQAVFKQFIHYVDSSSVFNNIPVIADVAGDAYTLSDYNWNRAFHTAEEYVRIMPAIADCPCDDIPADTISHSIKLINPASEWGQWEKQNVGIITRNGLSYGTYTVKVKMPELLNKQGIWNGLTNAIWLITQSHDAWNSRRTCEKEGYISDYYGAENKRIPNTSYSEIDFEILKTGPYCPEYRYAPFPLQPAANKQHRALWDLPYPGEGENSKDEIMVCCTNWDMACPQPADYQVGCQALRYNDLIFSNHRWDYWYKAITSKAPASDDELFGGDYYYFQIVWKPEEISWKIGPEKDKLRTVGYMNAGMTTIPNNQMVLIISQEFHNTAWWPGSPFAQGHIPFPAKDLIGEVLEVTIE